MSEEAGITLTVLVTMIVGFVLLLLGAVFTWFSLTTQAGIVSSRVLTPIGVVIALIGLLMLLAREG